MKEEFSSWCGCDDAIRLTKEVDELKELITAMNNGHSHNLGGKTLGNDLILYPVGLARYRLAFSENEKLKRQVQRQGRWLDKLTLWLRGNAQK